MASYYSDNSCFLHKNSISSLKTFLDLFNYFKTTKNRFAEAEISEIIDLNHYKLERNYLKARPILKQRFAKPFIFLHCLN